MIAWKHTGLGIIGSVLVSTFGMLSVGCASHYFQGVIEGTPFSLRLKITIIPVGVLDQLDLDELPYIEIEHEGQIYRFYPSRGLLYNPITGRLYQLDDSSLQKLLRELGLNGHNLIEFALDPQDAEDRVVSGQFKIGEDAIFGTANSWVGVKVSLQGDVPIPEWDVARWPTLDREMYIFPDGIEGSPDPIRVDLSGEAVDVFGYLVELGVQEGDAPSSEGNWHFVVDHETGMIDIFMDETLFTAIPIV